MRKMLLLGSRGCVCLGGLAVLGVVCGAACAEAPVYSNEPSGEFLKTWLLCGPFPLDRSVGNDVDTLHLQDFQKDFLEAHGGEKDARIEEGQVEPFEGGSATWVKHTTPNEYEVDLDTALSNEEPVAGYGYCEVESAADRVCLLSLGTNDGGRAWLNGELVWDGPQSRGLKADEDVIVVRLAQGRNRLLLKVEERGNAWGFCARFLPFDPKSIEDRFTLFRIESCREGVPQLKFLHPKSVAERIIKNVRLAIVRADEPAREVWEGPWTKERRMALPVDTGAYDRYLLRVTGSLTGCPAWSIALPFEAGSRVEHTLFDQGQTAYAIVVDPGASASEQWAAQELQHWLKEVSGAEFPVLAVGGTPAAQEIVVGFNARTQALLGGKAATPVDGDESFIYRNVGPSIVIYGGKDRGTMYGVMTFLEREMGCRWYTPQVTVTPQKERYAFDHLFHRESPGIRVRNDFYFEAFDPTWAARNKINGAMGYREQVGGVEAYWAVHTFYRFMPPSEFYEAHPEYYSLIDGKRVHDRAQLCLTNPDVLRIVTERLKQAMRDTPNNLIYSVSQNDWRNPCQCAACQAIVAREGSESGPVIAFVNQVAEAVEEEFPDKFVGTLAYQYTRTPCKTLKPRHNVVIRLCSIECCFSHDFLSCPENESFVSDLQGWAAISPHLYIWDYVVNFSHYIMPYPNFGVLQSNIQAFRDHKAIGIMEQAAYQSRGGEFAELRAYLISKLLWDPECDTEAVINDFMYGYYGRSGQYVRAYFDLLHGQVTPNTHIHLGLRPEDPLFTDAFVRDAEAIFDRAEAVADSEAIRQRVEMARLPVLYLKCLRTPGQAVYDGTYGRFCAIAEREGVTHYAERGAPHREAFHKRMETVE